MTAIDFARWPLVIVSLDEDRRDADFAALVGAVDSAAQRRSPFVLAIVASRRSLTAQARAAAKFRWLPGRRAEIGTWCRAVAYIVRGELEPSERDKATRAAERVWGSQVRITRSLDEAVHWLTAPWQPASTRDRTQR
jgi:hypothetical protein